MSRIRGLLSRFSAPLRTLRESFDASPVDSVETLTHFLHTRSSYVAQTSLHGYLKARMGTSYRYFFTDDEFSKSIRIASVRVFASCLEDLSLHAVAAARSGNSTQECVALAVYCYRDALGRCLDAEDRRHLPDDHEARFSARAALTDWDRHLRHDHAFARSSGDLVRFAPVVDEFRQRDAPIVTNSIRLRWLDVRNQFRRRMRADSLWRDWRRGPGAKATAPALDSDGVSGYDLSKADTGNDAPETYIMTRSGSENGRKG